MLALEHSAILFDLHLVIIGLENQFSVFESDCFTQVLLYFVLQSLRMVICKKTMQTFIKCQRLWYIIWGLTVFQRTCLGVSSVQRVISLLYLDLYVLGDDALIS